MRSIFNERKINPSYTSECTITIAPAKIQLIVLSFFSASLSRDEDVHCNARVFLLSLIYFFFLLVSPSPFHQLNAWGDTMRRRCCLMKRKGQNDTFKWKTNEVKFHASVSLERKKNSGSHSWYVFSLRLISILKSVRVLILSNFKGSQTNKIWFIQLARWVFSFLIHLARCLVSSICYPPSDREDASCTH